MPFESLVALLAVLLVPLSGTWPPAAKWLTTGRGRRWAVSAACMASLVAITCVLNSLVDSQFALALAAPLPQLAFVGLAQQVFVRTQRREPADVLFEDSPEPTPDMLYAFAVGVGCLAPFLFLIAAH